METQTKPPGNRAGSKNLSHEEKLRLLAMHQNGMTLSAIARAENLAVSTVRGVVMRAGVAETRVPRGARERNRPVLHSEKVQAVIDAAVKADIAPAQDVTEPELMFRTGRQLLQAADSGTRVAAHVSEIARRIAATLDDDNVRGEKDFEVALVARLMSIANGAARLGVLLAQTDAQNRAAAKPETVGNSKHGVLEVPMLEADESAWERKNR